MCSANFLNRIQREAFPYNWRNIILLKQIEKLEQKRQELAFLSGYVLKLCAMFSMVIDHGMKVVVFGAFFPLVAHVQIGSQGLQQIIINMWYNHLYYVGRFAFPIYCFLLVEGFTYTKNRKKYLKNMLVFALISEFVFDCAFFYEQLIAHHTFPFYWNYQNIFFTLLIGLLVLCGLEKVRDFFDLRNSINERKTFALKTMVAQLFFSAILILVGGFVAEFFNTDYQSIGILYITVLYLFRNIRLVQITIFTAMFDLPLFYHLLFYGFLFFYNGERGNRKGKFFFYWFYPCHLAALFLLQQGLFLLS